MKCPVCPDSTLAMSNRENIEIDYCPTCRGVWLDRGELDKIIERTVGTGASAASAPSAREPDPRMDPRQAPDNYRRYDDDDDYRKRSYGEHGHKRRRGGFLGDLFDFD